MVLDNDTRGWIMSCVSGIGGSPRFAKTGYTSNSFLSLCSGFEHHLCGPNSATHPWEKELQDSGQQYLFVVFT